MLISGGPISSAPISSAPVAGTLFEQAVDGALSFVGAAASAMRYARDLAAAALSFAGSVSRSVGKAIQSALDLRNPRAVYLDDAPYLTRAGLSGAADGKQGTVLVEFRLDTESGSFFVLSNGGSNRRVRLNLAAGGDVRLSCQNAAGDEILNMGAGTALVLDDGEYHTALASWDLAAGQTHLLVDAVTYSDVDDLDNDTVDYTTTAVFVGAREGGGELLDGALSMVFFDTRYADLSKPEVLQRFVTPSGRAAPLGSNGSAPFGAQPLLYLRLLEGEAVDAFAVNRGSGGDFTYVDGPATVDATYPGPVGAAGLFEYVREKTVTAALAFVGAITTGLILGRILEAALSFAGTFLGSARKALTATLSTAGTVSRAMTRSLTAAQSFAGTMAKRTARAITAALSSAGAVAASRWRVRAVDYDAADTVWTTTAWPGVADGPSGTISFWIDITSADGVTFYIFRNGGGYFFVARADILVGSDLFLDRLVVRGYSSTGILQMQLVSDQPLLASDGWTHVIASWDVDANIGRWYFDDVGNGALVSVGTGLDIHYLQGASYTLGFDFAGCLAEYWFDTSYIELSVEANRRKFVTADLQPVNLGEYGEKPTGSPPVVYLSRRPDEDPEAWLRNRARGNTFTESGTIEACADYPLVFHELQTTSVAGALSFVGSLAKRLARALTGALSFVGAQTRIRIVLASLTAALEFAGAFSKSTYRALAGAAPFVGVVERLTSRAVGGALSFSGAVLRTYLRALEAMLSLAGALSRHISAIRGGALSFAGLLNKRFPQPVSAALSFVGALPRMTAPLLSATLAPAGAFVKMAGKALSAELTLSSAAQRAVAHVLVATLATSAAVTKHLARAQAATLSVAGALAKTAQRALQGALSVAGALAKTAQRALSAALAPAGALVHPTLVKTLAAALAFAGLVQRRAGKALDAALGLSAALIEAARRRAMQVWTAARRAVLFVAELRQTTWRAKR